MSFSGVVSGASAVLTATSSFDDDVNISFMDMDIINTTPCPWSCVIIPGPIRTQRSTFGGANSHDVTWSIMLGVWLPYDSKMSTWQTNTKIVMQDVIDAITGSDTLNGAVDHTEVELVDVGTETRGKRQFNQFTFLLEPIEYDV